MVSNCQAANVLILPLLPSFGDPKSIPKNPVHAADKDGRVEQPRNVRIIVIDDEALIVETVVEILNDEGFDAIAASTGADAIELAKTFCPDIVLSDVIMPGLNGVEVGIKLREILPSCKIILFSGQAATVDLLEGARQMGHHFDVLAKPVKPQQLVSFLRANSGHRS